LHGSIKYPDVLVVKWQFGHSTTSKEDFVGIYTEEDDIRKVQK